MGMIYTLICNDGTVYVGDETKTCANNGGKKSSSGGTIDWTKLGATIPRATQTPVLCKDGTTDFSLSSSNAIYDNSKVCANNGGRAENNIIYTPEPVKNAPIKGKEDITKKIFGAYNKNLIIAVVLVAGYFAYKKFKK